MGTLNFQVRMEVLALHVVSTDTVCWVRPSYHLLGLKVLVHMFNMIFDTIAMWGRPAPYILVAQSPGS